MQCREMNRTGFDRIIKEAIDDGLVYIGISARSIYAAGNLNDGLRVIHNSIIPHLGGPRLVKLPYDGGKIKLADGKAVYIEDDCIQLV